MASLPTVGSDSGAWGTKLNGFLVREHNSDGTHNIPDVAAKLYLTAQQNNLVDSTETLVALDTVGFDTGTQASASINRIIPDSAGYHLVTAAIKFTNVVANKKYMLRVYKNTDVIATCVSHSSLADDLSCTISQIVNCNGTSDYLTIKATSYAGADTVDIASGVTTTFLSIFKIR